MPGSVDITFDRFKSLLEAAFKKRRVKQRELTQFNFYNNGEDLFDLNESIMVVV